MRPKRLAVIGDGIIGSSIAYEASLRGLSVTQFAQFNAGQGSVAAGGMLTPAMEADLTSPALFELAKLSRDLYPAWIRTIESRSQIDTGYRQSGTLEVALHRDHLSDLEQLEAHQAQLGFSTRRLSSAEVLEREPQLTHRVQGALLAENDHCVEPRRLLCALNTLLKMEEVRRVETRSVRLAPKDGHIFFESNQETQSEDFDEIIVAAGARAGALLPELELDLRPVKGQFIRVKSAESLSSVVRTPDVYLIPRLDNEIYIGASQEEVGFQDGTTLGEIMDLLTDAWRTFPILYDAEIIETGFGYRPALNDGNPLLGRLPQTKVSVAIGHFRHGVLLAPASAKVLLDQLLEPHPEFDMSAFAPR
jgi:glycine oxidase